MPTTKISEEYLCRNEKILNLWYQNMRTMKSIKYQNDEACLNFDENIKQLNKAANSLIEQNCFRMLHNWNVQITQISPVFWLGNLRLLKTWRTLGAVDEQNIEGVHPQFNQLVRCFGLMHFTRIIENFLSQFVWLNVFDP